MTEKDKIKGKRAMAALVVGLIIGASGFVYGTYAFVSTGMNPSQGAQNQPPSLASCSITPGSAYKTTTLTAVPSGASDPDGDSITCFYRWYKNGLVIPSQLGNTLAPTYFAKGDSITVQVIPYDGKQVGTGKNASTTILNSAPSLSYASVSPTNPSKTSTLVASPGSYNDADSDAPSAYYYRWFKNWNRISGASAASYVLQGANNYDEFWVEMKPFDGTANGTATNSSHVVVRWSFGGGYCAPAYNDTEVFVSGVSGIDAIGRGNQTHPCQTITYGIARALATGKAHVIVAQGTYDETIDLVDGISVLGGYSQDFELFNANELRAEVRATSQRWTLRGVSIVHPTRVEGLVIHGPMIATPGVSTYGIYLSDCNASLVIANCTILGGGGGSGISGTAGTNGQEGNNGNNGVDARPYPGSGTNTGGTGGILVDDGNDISGGAGGTANYSAYNVQQASGLVGQGTGGGSAGAGGRNFYFRSGGTIDMPAGPIDGISGIDGADGSDGNGGFRWGSQQGTISGAEWLTASGTEGMNGSYGAGGGGGGGGGCQFNEVGFGWLGGSGGGGGSGGCFGSTGGGGGGGGGAICVFVYFNSLSLSIPVILNCTLYLGKGGDGGDGGAGGIGGRGGSGGIGGVSPGLNLPEALVGRGGDGGNGGCGGNGGGGAGGNGGCAFGFLTYHAGTPSYDAGNTITTSTGIAGGRGGGGAGGYAGQSGYNGVCLATYYF